MQRRIAVPFSVLALAGILTAGCGLKMESCTSNNKCVTTAATPYDAVEAALVKEGYTTPPSVGKRTLTEWKKDDTTVTIDRNTDGSKVSIKFREGTVTCDDIGANPAGIDTLGFIKELHKLGHDEALKKPLCHT